MSKFILVQQFDPEYMDYGFDIKPFWINIDHIEIIRHYDENIHAALKYDPITKEHRKEIPKGALDTIYVNFNNGRFGYHLDVESSKKVLEAIKE